MNIYNFQLRSSQDPNKDVTYSTIGDAPVSDAVSFTELYEFMCSINCTAGSILKMISHFQKPPAGGTIYTTVAPH